MDDLQPMRPVSVQPDERQAAPMWKRVSAYGFVALVGLMAFLVDNGSPWTISIGVAVSVSGAVLFALSCRRTFDEHTGVRIPWIGPPPNSPRRQDLLSDVGAPLALFGALLAAGNSSIPWPVALPVVIFVFVGSTVCAFAVHNRRVTTTSDA
ncbi:hypothetical protein D8W71_10630 [Rhodococcus sp. P1Y]|nr:hypothetical protein D8W71_10630 [Rhodococcus sp. P1Y]